MAIDPKRDALIVVDLQPDFMPGGPLAVAEGDRIAGAHRPAGAPFLDGGGDAGLAPGGHMSRSPSAVVPGRRTAWRDSPRSGSAPRRCRTSWLRQNYVKVPARDVDSYSGFRGRRRRRATGLAGYLRERGVERLYVCGLARDFCVRATAIDGARAGFQVFVVDDLTRAVDPVVARARRRASSPRPHVELVVDAGGPVMSLETLTVDAYQLTTLVAHADAGRTAAGDGDGVLLPQAAASNRNYVLFCGLRQILEHAAEMRLDEGELETLLGDPLLGPALQARPALVAALRALDGFDGEIDALPEGTPAFAGPALRTRRQAASPSARRASASTRRSCRCAPICCAPS